MSSVELVNAVKRFGDAEVIHGMSLAIEKGDFVVFVGPSGCGKSTLLRMIAGLEDLSDGEVHIGGRDVTEVAAVDRGIAMVFQSYALYPHMTVAENMGFGLKMNGVAKEVVAEKVAAAAGILQLEALLDRKPKNLSGGQRQRVAIGRAIVRNPEVFLFDEPLSNLDAELRVEMRLQIARLHKRLEATMIYVTHDQVEAMTMADKIVVLRAGYLEQMGSPLELYQRPRNLFVAGFIGSPKMNFLNGVLDSTGADSTVVKLESDQLITVPVNSSALTAGDTVTVGIRPEDMLNDDGEITLEILVDVVERLGGSTFLYGTCCNTQNFVTQRAGADGSRVGESVTLRVTAERVYLFDSQGMAVGL
ncbi:ABC transporter [Chromatiales bacterium (ex Bugula neritina AB1)]|nr:ABC transporter [Chromatiales bacterium (ex Bugula neritina AB1)]